MSPCYLKTSMASQAQIEANRRNSQKSTGPATSVGKAAASLNAVKSGVYAESLIIHSEDPETLEALAREYQSSCRPVGPLQPAAVDALIHADWLLRRMRRVETLVWNDQIERWAKSNDRPVNAETVPLIGWYRGDDHLLRIQRRLTALDRAYHRAFADLQRLQLNRPPAADPIPAEPPAAQIGFVPSPETVVVLSDPPDPPSLPPAAGISPTLIISRNQERCEMQQAPEISTPSSGPLNDVSDGLGRGSLRPDR
jgi:hypothetical protein